MGIKVYGGNATLGANSFTGVQLLPGGAVGAPSLALSANPTTGVWWRNSNAFNLSFQGTMRYEFGAGGDLNIGGGSLVGLLMNGVNAQTVNDTGVCRVSSGVVEVNNGSAAGFAVIRTNATVVASLPSAATVGAGARSFVTDANATTFMSTVAGGGANKVPVVSDGANWKIA